MHDGPGYDDWITFRIGETDMNRINCYSFYTLGKWVSRVELLSADTRIMEIAVSALRTEHFLKVLLQGDLRLKATNEASSSLFKGCQTLVQILDEEAESEKKASRLRVDMVLSGIRKSIEKMEHVMSAELVMAPIYSVPSRGVFSTDSLLDSADDVFEDAKQKIPEEARADTRQAGRCLAFDLPTAAGFHIARATEAMITTTLTALGCPPPKESQRNWGMYIKLMEECQASQTLVHHLGQLKDLHRNPLIHPEVTLTQLEAQQLWSLCTSAILAMLAEIDSRTEPQGV